MFGVYRKPSEFVEEVEKFPRPFYMFCDVPDCVLKLIFLILTKGPVGMAKHRMRKIGQWRKWLSELEPQEKALHEGMDAEVGLVFEAYKNILLMSKIAEDIGWPDKSICDDIAPGFYLTGIPEPAGVFLPEVSIPNMTVEHLDELSSIITTQFQI